MTALPAVIVSLPEPPTKFSTPQITSLPLLRRGDAAAIHEPGAEIGGDGGGHRRHVEGVVATRHVAVIGVVAVSAAATMRSLPPPAKTVSLPAPGVMKSSPSPREDPVGACVAEDHVGSVATEHVVVAGAGHDRVATGIAL